MTLTRVEFCMQGEVATMVAMAGPLARVQLPRTLALELEVRMLCSRLAHYIIWVWVWGNPNPYDIVPESPARTLRVGHVESMHLEVEGRVGAKGLLPCSPSCMWHVKYMCLGGCRGASLL